jgi:hypothetical protein
VKDISVLDRILLLITSLTAAYQVVQGVEGLGTLAVASYTVGFGVLVVAALLMIILGFDVLDSPLVVIASTLIPLSISLGLVSEYLQKFNVFYITFTILGFLAIVISRFVAPGKIAVIILALVHGVSGLLIFILPLVLVIQGAKPLGFMLITLGGGLIGVGGLLLSFLKTGKPILSRQTILATFPGLLLLATTAFVAGFAFA